MVEGGRGELRLVTDFETAAVGDPAFDFRCLPARGGTLDLFDEVVAAYEAASGRTPDVLRVLGWHIRTVLGDALWRSEAGVALPGGGTPSSCADDLDRRLWILTAR